MHYHCEIIMPPVTDFGISIEDAVAQVMAPYKEEWNPSFEKIKDAFERGDDDESHDLISDLVYQQRHAFWDWYQIGGRWSQCPEKLGIDPEAIKEFYRIIKERGVTVSGLRMGKQEISPASQIPDVDALWHEMVPNYPGEHCPLFAHSGQGNEVDAPGNVMILAEACLDKLQPARVMLADWKTEYDASKPEGERLTIKEPREVQCCSWSMYERSDPNTVKDILDRHGRTYMTQDWIIGTVDYHN